MKFIYYLEGASPRAAALIIYRGYRGSYRFIWSGKHNAHIFEGRELDAVEFNKLVHDLYIGVENPSYPCVPRVIVEPREAAEPMPTPSESDLEIAKLRETNALLTTEVDMLTGRLRALQSAASELPRKRPKSESLA